MQARRALLIVDVQNDFCEGGALAVNGGAQVAAEITAHLRAHVNDYAMIAASRDYHSTPGTNGGHFSLEPDYVDTWPVHCVEGTNGAEFHPKLDESFVNIEVRKGMGRPAYSAFDAKAEVVDHRGQSLVDILKDDDITEIDIVGIAFDHCVKASALDAARAGFTVRILAPLTAAVTPANNDTVTQELENAGVQVEGKPLSS